MENSYFEESTLYAISCVLAFKRILLLDGIYLQLDDNQLGKHLKRKLLYEFDVEFDKLQFIKRFFYYDRIALAEAVMERENGNFRISTFLEVKKIQRK